jgi:hypothetical protein
MGRGFTRGPMTAGSNRPSRAATAISRSFLFAEGAYKVGDVFSEPFPSHDVARRAAERAAREQVLPGESTDISYEDKDGRWHEERSSGSDRPETDVEG